MGEVDCQSWSSSLLFLVVESLVSYWFLSLVIACVAPLKVVPVVMGGWWSVFSFLSFGYR